MYFLIKISIFNAINSASRPAQELLQRLRLVAVANLSERETPTEVHVQGGAAGGLGPASGGME
jgi:hypothetical protein